MVRTTATTASTHSKHIMHKFIQIPMKVVVKGAGEGRGAYLDSKMTGWAGSAPKTTLLGPASFSLAKQLNGEGGGGGGGGGGRRRGVPNCFLRSATIHNIHHVQRIFLCNRRQ